jgi:hypothetical protein
LLEGSSELPSMAAALRNKVELRKRKMFSTSPYDRKHPQVDSKVIRKPGIL